MNIFFTLVIWTIELVVSEDDNAVDVDGKWKID